MVSSIRNPPTAPAPSADAPQGGCTGYLQIQRGEGREYFRGCQKQIKPDSAVRRIAFQVALMSKGLSALSASSLATPPPDTRAAPASITPNVRLLHRDLLWDQCHVPKNSGKTWGSEFWRRVNISIITRIELLGWKGHTPEGLEKAKKLLDCARCLPLTVAIAESTIDIRSDANISLPDAVIAASALSLNATLITRNVKDFHDVPGLVVYNPFSK